jgi:hypothetical protein
MVRFGDESRREAAEGYFLILHRSDVDLSREIRFA